MINVETTRPVYSSFNADKVSTRKTKAENKLAENQKTLAATKAKRDAGEKLTKEERKAFGKASVGQAFNKRKAKRNAKKLLRVSKPGGTKFFYPLTQLFGKKKKNKDGTTTDIAPENSVVVKNSAGKTTELDKVELAKALDIPVSQVTPAKVQEVVVNVPAATAGSVTASETSTPAGEPVLAIEVKDANVTIADDGSAYLSSETQLPGETKNVADEDKEAQKKAKIGKIILISGAIIVVVGAILYFVNKEQKK